MTARPVRWALPTARTVAEAVGHLRGDERPFALVGDWLGAGGALLGSAPVEVAGPDADPFAVLDRQPTAAPGEARVGGGWVGFLGYRLGALVEALPPGPPAPVPLPPFALARHDHVVRFDGERWWFEALVEEGREAALEERHALWAGRLSGPPPPPRPAATTPFAAVAPGVAGHLDAVAETRARIAAGDLFQANVTLRLEARLDGDPLDLLARALRSGAPRCAAYLGGPWGAVVSLSPERYLRREGRVASSEPIKGTGADPAALRASAKDAAEHVMIVDLVRNDLGRVSRYGTVTAHAPRTERYADVHHAVSTVTGALRDGVTDADLVRATFPPGSVTGAPKIQAQKVIAALEATRREVYTGAIGIASPLAGLDLSVAIRTFEARGGRIWLGVGGGVVADSTPEGELAEALAKAAGPVAAIGGTLASIAPGEGVLAKAVSRSDTTRVRSRNRPFAATFPRGARPPHATDFGPRPDPACGLIETILVEDGHAVRGAEHLERLRRSARETLDLDLPPGAERHLAGSPSLRRRLRLVVDRDRELTATHEAIVEREPAPLQPFLLPGGLGAHKWADRRLVDALARTAPGTVALLIDTDGAVLEAAWASVWIREGDAWLTPPADGRILPGVTRAHLLATCATAREDPFDSDRLHAADEVRLSSAIAGWRTVPDPRTV